MENGLKPASSDNAIRWNDSLSVVHMFMSYIYMHLLDFIVES